MCSKEPSHWDGSLEYPQHMFWLRNKNINVSLCYALLTRDLKGIRVWLHTFMFQCTSRFFLCTFIAPFVSNRSLYTSSFHTIPVKCLEYICGWYFLNCRNLCFFSFNVILGLSMTVFIILTSSLLVHTSVCCWYSLVDIWLQNAISEKEKENLELTFCHRFR